MTTQASEVEVWSTKVDDNYDYCLFKLSTAYNQGYATDLAVMRNSKTALTVSSKGHICHYDYGAEDITALRTMHHAHSDCINGVSFNPDSNENVFATSSDDKSILIWDLRIKTKRMASGLYEYNGASFHGIHWSTLTENKGLVLAGDIAGNLFSFDVRKPFVVYSKISASDRCIRKIIFNGLVCSSE